MGPTLKMEKDCIIAITGGNLSPTIDGQIVPMWRPVYVKKGQVLQFGRCKSGCRSYLSVAGGYVIREVMNSKSTYLRGKIGGYKGRALQADDIIDFNECPAILKHWSNAMTTTKWFVHHNDFLPNGSPVIRFIKGSQFEYFTDLSKAAFVEQCFKITLHSDRMGYRMSGPTLELKDKRELLSEAVSNGSVQVPQTEILLFYFCGPSNNRRLSENCSSDYGRFVTHCADEARREYQIFSGNFKRSRAALPPKRTTAKPFKNFNFISSK